MERGNIKEARERASLFGLAVCAEKKLMQCERNYRLSGGERKKERKFEEGITDRSMARKRKRKKIRRGRREGG